jgi:hypothetical protein
LNALLALFVRDILNPVSDFHLFCSNSTQTSTFCFLVFKASLISHNRSRARKWVGRRQSICLQNIREHGVSSWHGTSTIKSVCMACGGVRLAKSLTASKIEFMMSRILICGATREIAFVDDGRTPEK